MCLGFRAELHLATEKNQWKHVLSNALKFKHASGGGDWLASDMFGLSWPCGLCHEATGDFGHWLCEFREPQRLMHVSFV